ncbi:MAG: CopG family transcriptional regulator [Thermoanaerobaculia bacterium]
MATEKVSLTLEEELVAEARKASGSRGLSNYVNRALGRQLQHERLTRLLEDLEEQAGPIDDEVLEEVRRAWPAPGHETGERRNG